jgi:signal transduction histidine kinase
VRARNGRTVWSETARVAFVIHPPFWGTWWFRAIAALAVTGGLLLIYLRRVRALERARRDEQKFSREVLESQERERKRIAGELHDGLVQTLLVAKNRSLLGLQKSGDPARVSRELSEISGALSDAIEEVRELAHNLRPYQLDRLGLTAALRALAGSLSRSSQIAFSADLENIDALFGPEPSTTIYRIVQESATNVLKHSGATAAAITVKQRSRVVEITVSDNGAGFAAGNRPGASPPGFGLSGIVQRAIMLGGTAAIDPAAGRGTTVSVTIPIASQEACVR